MATILAHVTVKPGKERQWEQTARSLYEGTHANETAVRRYEYWRGAEPRTYYVLLSFEDYRGFLAHQSAEHHEDEVGPIGDAVESMWLEWVDPLSEASPLVPTEMQHPGRDAGELAATYAVSHPAEVQDWWQALRGDADPGNS